MTKLTQIIKQAYLSLVSSDDTDYPQGQGVYNGKTTNFTRYSPYGLNSNPPLDSWVLLLSSQGQEGVKFGLISDFLNRKKELLEGEVVLYNTLTGSYVYLKENGDIEVNAQNNLTATVAGTANVTATTQVTLTAPIVSLVGNVGFGSGVITPATGVDVGANAITSKEITPPATPGALQAASYFKDNGSGKTQFAVKWKSGAETIIATEP